MMGCDVTGGGANCSSASSSPNGKRARDPEDEVYLDNFHSQKRYLSEIMASSLNGLRVGDSNSQSLPESIMDSPARSDAMIYLRDENCYSPMSEDSDEYRCDSSIGTPMSQTDNVSCPTSPVSPQKQQKSAAGLFSTSNPYPLPGCNLAAVVCHHHSRQRGSDSEGRHPSSPNDMCHIADLRRAALLRSVQMRTQPQCSPAYELPSNSCQESIQSDDDEEGEDGTYAEVKSSTTDEVVEYGSLERVSNQVVERCSENCTSRDEPHCDGNSSAVKCPAADRRRTLL